ncbi:MAG TPA: dihydrofolate reductase family protein [Polyangiales bacterium]|jgi:dihydrofolate reductase
MRRLTTFTFVSLDGYYEDANHDLSWHGHDQTDSEDHELGLEGLRQKNVLLFGRVTYQMMTNFWPTPQAGKTQPEMARLINAAEKIVFSRTLERADWGPTRIIREDPVAFLRELKRQPGPDLTLLGSGSVLTQLADAGLVDEYQILIDPIALGAGSSLFKDLRHRLKLTVKSNRTFKSGDIFLTLTPATSD